tara:strand:- start:1084 stop:1227 length:144 start_codon:yes stop_codon:yes gene_type:complete
MSAESQQGANTGPSEEKFDRTYRQWNPNPTQGPNTEVIATILKPQGS